jgi:hypothetical protein
MTQNIPLMIALRRNRQQRGLDEFLALLTQATGLSLDEQDIISADTSVDLEGLLYATIQERLKNGSLLRTSELTWDEIQERIDHHAPRSKSHLVVFLCHHSDFAFRIGIDIFSTHAKRLIEFDGDTVYAATEDVTHGVGIDMYESELVHAPRYTLDLWCPSGKPA